jgi:hypothetical protein
MPQFNPKRVLRQTSNALLKGFFSQQNLHPQVSWDQLRETQVDEVFRALQALPDDPRERIEVVLQDLDDVANEDGVQVMIEEASFRGVDIADDLEAMDSRFDKAMWVLLRHPDIWKAASMFARADDLSSGRSWRRRCDMPTSAPSVDDDHKAKLEKALSAFYRERQGRGHHCHVDHFLRGGKQHYFFVYLSDYAGTHINFDDRGQFRRSPERRAFEVVFAYEQESGTLEMFAKGGIKVVEPLQQIFSRVILGKSLPPENPKAKPYKLDHLMKRGMGFPTDPEDGIREVSIRRMRLSVVGNRRRRLLLEPDAEDGPDAVYDMLEEDLNRQKLPRSILHVTKVTFRFLFDGQGRRKSLTFDVTYPNSCNLKSKREEHRLLGEKYLKRYGIDAT